MKIIAINKISCSLKIMRFKMPNAMQRRQQKKIGKIENQPPIANIGKRGDIIGILLFANLVL
ncbi:MAG: hypothetical protein HQ565_13605 [Bacteroidetes bacterium]|nr:hypothetical protein [Bacteroidota bacterium]